MKNEVVRELERLERGLKFLLVVGLSLIALLILVPVLLIAVYGPG